MSKKSNNQNKSVSQQSTISSNSQPSQSSIIKSKLLKTINLITFPIITYIIFTQFLPLLYHFNYPSLQTECKTLYGIIKDFSFEKSNDESLLTRKIKIIVTTLFLFGIYLLFLIKMTIFSRIISGNEGLHRESHSFTILLNCNIQNSIEQMFIFLSLFSYWILTNSDTDQVLKFIVFGFILSRILYTIGCLMSYFTGIYVLRSCGFIVGSAINYYILCLVFNLNPPSYLDLNKLF